MWAAESGETVDDAPPVELVNKIKCLQRTNAQAKKAWMEYCDAQLGGKHDPSLHDAPALTAFLESWEAMGEAGGNGPQDSPPTDLVEKVKQVQRLSPQGRQAWMDHCDGIYGGGTSVHDPSRHKASTLRDFLQWWTAEGQYGGTTRPKGASAKGMPPLAGQADFITQGSRLSLAFKAAWVQYCRKWGRGFSDPAKYEEAFLSEFATYVAHLVQADIAGNSHVEPTLSPQKRAATVDAIAQKAVKKAKWVTPTEAKWVSGAKWVTPTEVNRR